MHFDNIDEFWSTFMSQAFSQDDGGPGRIFRGVTDKSYELLPSIGRDTKNGTYGDISSIENDLIEEFKRLSVPELESSPATDFEWLFLAQHYGLPTRLLDWSSNPLVALFFATERKDDVDGALYIARRQISDQYDFFDYRTADYTSDRKKEPISVLAIQPNQGEVVFIRPRYTDRRYQNQKSVFSCPKDPFRPLSGSSIEKIEFSGCLKSEIRSRLRSMGVSASFIYPGLGGISAEVKSFYFDPVTSGRMQVLTARMKI